MRSNLRLPRSIIPLHYELALTPDLDASTFVGSERVDVEVKEAVREVVLNAAELEISNARLESPGGDTIGLTVRLDADAEIATLVSSDPIPPGRWTLACDFAGILNDHLRGFYRSTYTDEEGEIQTIAVTQFEATDARRAFPCWDEPDLKATFRVALTVARHLLAISNTPQVEERLLLDGTREVRFAKTIRMSTYLLAFVVGPLEVTEPRDVDGVPLRIVHSPGKGELTGFALDAATFALRYLSEYYGIPYPGSKLDLIALPDFAWGAMENIGAVTFRENLLIVDPKRASHAERLRIADVIAHEIAHMWFGDLVTMKWWNGIWLNEAFATFMELKTTDAARPDWDRWTMFGIEAGAAKEIDALASTRSIEFEVDSPDEANEMFDSLTYLKGSSVLRMLEQHIGEDAFCTGVGRYLQTHEYGNTETVDLWQALDDASGHPVAPIMDSWIRQGGFPVVTVAPDGEGYRLTQRRFTLLPEVADDRTWHIPMRFRSLTDGTELTTLLSDRSDVTGPVRGPIVANAGGHGFYVVRYEQPLLDEVLEHYDRLQPLERFLLIDDAWGLTLAGMGGLDSFLSLLPVIAGEMEPSVWQVAIGAIGQIDRFVDDATRGAFRVWAASVLRPTLERLGWEAAAGDGDLTRKLRGMVINAMGRFVEDEATIERCRSIVSNVIEGQTTVDPDVVHAAIGVVAWNGSVADYGAFVARYEEPATPQERVRFLFALPSFPEATMAGRTFEMVVDGRIRNQDGPYILAGLLSNRRVNVQSWEMLKDGWAEIGKVLPETTSRRVLHGLPSLTQPEVAEDVKDWFDRHPTRHRKTQAQQLELLEVYRRFREREAAGLAALFAR